MGKKSKAKAAPSLRCVECKVFMKSVDKGVECPGCDRLFCETCAFSGRKGNVPFMCCHNKDCQSPSRCSDCAFGTTLNKNGEENRRRRERGEQPVVKERGDADFPMSSCGHCHEMLCHNCSTFQTKGYEGHYFCMEKGCYKTRCFKCCVESGDPKHFVMHCFGCDWSKCSECDPGKTWDSSTGNYYCGKCSSDENIVSNKNGLVLASTMNRWMHDNRDKKVFKTTTQSSGQRKATTGVPKYQYYQDDNFMKVQVLEPYVLPENLDVKFSPNELTVRIKKQEAKGRVEYAVIDGILAHEVDVSKCKYIIKDENVTIKLRKKEMVEWETLLGDRRGKNHQKSRVEKQAEEDTNSSAAVNAVQRSSFELASIAQLDTARGCVVKFARKSLEGSYWMTLPKNATQKEDRYLAGQLIHQLQIFYGSSENRCIHVEPHPNLQECTKLPFIHTYFTELIKNLRSSSNKFTPNVVLDAVKTTMNKHANVLLDDTKRILIANFFVGLGVENLLHHNKLEDALMSAVAIRMLDLDDKEQRQQDTLKYRDAMGGCIRSLYKFFIDRMNCSCLDEKYSHLKAEQPKTGVCDQCKERSERNNLFACSKCNEAQYCSRVCQIAHWPLHRCFGGGRHS